jgi:hypothetical protein
MRHFTRTTLGAEQALAIADTHFAELGLARASTPAPARGYAGPLGSLTLRTRSEGGHATLVEIDTDQPGESRLDRNVKRYFVRLRRAAEPGRALEASY